jgi:protein-tyrosine phosphatase
MTRVAFVCLGNICRSPLAEAAFRAAVANAKLGERFEITSFGTGDWHVGRGADPRSVQVARARGVDLTRHRAKQFTPDAFARFDYVVAMDRANVRALRELAPTDEARAKIALMRSFDAHDERDGEVPDPYYGEDEDFERVMDMCERASAALLARLTNAGA